MIMKTFDEKFIEFALLCGMSFEAMAEKFAKVQG